MDGLAEKKILVVCGPTASGKTELAVELASRFNGEMVGADSMQIYAGLPIGTAAITEEEAKGVPQHMVGFLPPDKAYSVAEYLKDARQAIDAIISRGKLPVVCGGTGMYVSGIVKGMRFTDAEKDENMRKNLELQWEEKGAEAMLTQVASFDPEHAASLHLKDKKRILRAIEQHLVSGGTIGQRNRESIPEKPPYSCLCVAPYFHDRQDLYNRIHLRVDGMLKKGLLEEARLVYNNRKLFVTATQAIGYKEFFPYFEGEKELDGCVEKLKQATRNYAKRQMTWFRKLEGLAWLPFEQDGMQGLIEEGERLTGEFLQKQS